MLRPLAFALLLFTPALRLHAQAGHDHTGPAPERLGRVDFAIRLPARGSRPPSSAAWRSCIRSGTRKPAALPRGGRRRFDLRPGVLGPRDERAAPAVDAADAGAAGPGPGRRRARGAAQPARQRGRATMPRPSRSTIAAVTRSMTVPGFSCTSAPWRPWPDAGRRIRKRGSSARSSLIAPGPAQCGRLHLVAPARGRPHPRAALTAAMPTIRASPTTSSMPTTPRRSRATAQRRPTATRSIAPSVPHAEHMPSHIYTGSARGTSRSRPTSSAVEAARRFEVAEHAGAMWDQRAHALDYLAYAYLQLGRDADARAVAAQVAGVTETFPAAALTTGLRAGGDPGAPRARAGRLAAPRRRCPVRPAPAWRGAEGITRFARALGAGARRPRGRPRAPRSTRSPNLERTPRGGRVAPRPIGRPRCGSSGWPPPRGWRWRRATRSDALRQGRRRRRSGRRGREASRHARCRAAGARAVRRPAGPGRPPGRGAGRLHAGAGAAAGPGPVSGRDGAGGADGGSAVAVPPDDWRAVTGVAWRPRRAPTLAPPRAL